MLTDINLIQARAAIQVNIEEGLDWIYAVETAQTVYSLSGKEVHQIIEDILNSIWYKDRMALERN